MRKTNKNLTKQILTLMLAFVMVFTGMGIGSWGVDEAWADQTTTQQIVVTASGVEQHNQYDQRVTSNIKITGGNSKIQAESEPKERNVYILTLESADDVKIVNKTGKKLLKYQCYVTETGGLSLGKEGTNIINLKTSTQTKITSTGFPIGKLNIEADSFYFFYFNFGTAGGVTDGKDFALLIQIVPPKNVDKNALNAAIAAAPDTSDSIYYHENDRWNGRVYNEDGFWADMRTVVEAAQTIADNEKATQAKVDAAAKTLDRKDSDSALSKAIANLIPTSQLNATKLYEALRPLYWISIENQATYEELGEHWKVTADNCTQASWAAYTRATEPAAAYLAKLFDKDGNATAFNEAEAAKGDQPGETEADKLADAIDPTQLVNQEKYDTAYQNWKEREAEANLLLQQYDPAKLTEAEYTKPSWKTYTDTYHALKEIAEYRIIGGTRADYDMLHSLYQNGDWLTNLLPESYNKLESKGDITVTLQYTNGLAAAYPAVRTSCTDAYCGEVSLTDGNRCV